MSGAHDEEVNQFMAFTGADQQTANFYLESCNWNVQTAVDNFLTEAEMTPSPEMQHQSSGNQPMPPPDQMPSAARPSKPTPPRRGVVRSLADLGAESHCYIQLQMFYRPRKKILIGF